MEALFLKMVNMSITASYVILALLLIRLLLKKAPKKYSYLLWSAALFRLICPVSFSAVFSIFQMKPFNMSAAQSGGGPALSYVPADIVYMETPSVTVGIPYMNSVISESLPAATPYASVNPMQIWIFLGTILWCAGIVLLFSYNFITYARLKHRMATAIRLEDNVYESDKIRSPFILGFFRPRIFIPFGLGKQEREYILRHERHHLKRKDHWIKLLGLCVLTLHWFNPLVWIAYGLMIKDMEMSCDEKVLAETDGNIAHEYSMSLLSFAANRKFPAVSPLAFGEAGVKERVKNVLRAKPASKQIIAFAVVLCTAAIAACAANPIQSGKTPGDTDEGQNIYGGYVFDEQIYMNPLSSFRAFGEYKQYYMLSEYSLVIIEENGDRREIPMTYEETEMDEQTFENLFMMGGIEGQVDISSYEKRCRLMKDSRPSPEYHIYRMDDEIWLANLRNGGGYFWSIYKIGRYDEEIPVKITIYGTDTGVEHFLSLSALQTLKEGLNLPSGSRYMDGTCYNITPKFISQNFQYQIFKYEHSRASFLLYEDEVYPLGFGIGNFGITSMELADINGDGMPELYFAFSFGSGMHRAQSGYFDPAAKQTTHFEYVHLKSDDLMFARNNDGGLSLYRAAVNSLLGATTFEVKKYTRLFDVVYRDDEIALDPLPEAGHLGIRSEE